MLQQHTPRKDGALPFELQHSTHVCYTRVDLMTVQHKTMTSCFSLRGVQADYSCGGSCSRSQETLETLKLNSAPVLSNLRQNPAPDDDDVEGTREHVLFCWVPVILRQRVQFLCVCPTLRAALTLQAPHQVTLADRIIRCLLQSGTDKTLQQTETAITCAGASEPLIFFSS